MVTEIHFYPFGPVTCSSSGGQDCSCETSLNGLCQPTTPRRPTSKMSCSSRAPQSLIKDIPALPGGVESTAHWYKPEGMQEALPGASQLALRFCCASDKHSTFQVLIIIRTESPKPVEVHPSLHSAQTPANVSSEHTGPDLLQTLVNTSCLSH